MIKHDLNLYEVCNTTDQHYQKQIHYISLILLTFLGIFLKENQKIIKWFYSFYVITLCMHSTPVFRIFRQRKVTQLLIKFYIHLKFYDHLSNHLNVF